MHIRTAHSDDITQLHQLYMQTFMHNIAPLLSDEGITTFQQIATESSIQTRLTGSDFQVWVAENRDAETIGAAELKKGQHLAMLFVAPSQQRQGIGHALVQHLLSQSTAPSITVSASLSSVEAYQRYGFEICGEVDEHAGLVFQPMIYQRVKSIA